MNIIATNKLRSTISLEEMDRRKEAVRQAYASNRIEGLFVSSESDAVFQSFVRGDFGIEELGPRLKAAHLRP